MVQLANLPRLERLMDESGLDGVVATQPENVTYATGYWAMSQWIRRGPQAYGVLPRKAGTPVIVASGTALDHLVDQDEVWVKTVRRYGFFAVEDSAQPLGPVDAAQAALYALPDDRDPISSLAAALAEAGLDHGTVGIDEPGLMPSMLEALKTKLPAV